jgi:uncharacterized integral membrane protein
MLRFIRLLLAALAIIVLVAFAIANRQPVDVSFAPLPVWMELPLYGIFLVGLVFGVLIGAAYIWFSALARGRQVRRLRNRNWALENQLNLMKQQEEKAEAQRQASARAVAVPRAAA